MYNARAIAFLLFVGFASLASPALADTGSWGLWKSENDSSPAIEVTVKRRIKELRINNKLLPANYAWTNGKEGHGLMEFSYVEQLSSGAETHIGVYLVRGSAKNKPLLSGFFYHIEYDSEGRATKDVTRPISLKLHKAYEWND